MMTIEQLRKIKDGDTSLLAEADEYDLYLVKLMQRFKEKINPEEYFLSYSGGKDSHFLYWFIKEVLQENRIKIIGINTYMEHHEILKRILNNSDIVLYPELKPMEIKAKYGSPCFSKSQDDFIERYQKGSRAKSTINRIYSRNEDGSHSQYGVSKKARELLLAGKLHRISPKCCKYLKKNPSHKFEKETGLKPILGIRGGESVMREGKYRACLSENGKFTPIWDLTQETIDELYKRYNIELPEVYNHILRTGCMGCPYGSYKHDTEKELKLITPAQKRFVTEYFKESYEVLGIKVDEDAR